MAEHAKGFKAIAEAVFLRDHVLRQIELAEHATDPEERGGPDDLRRGRALGLPTRQGRLLVSPTLSVPGHDNVYAAGDVAAHYHPGEVTPMTAQHALRQGRIAGINVAASLGHGQSRPYRHRDLGFVVDLAGAQAVADPPLARAR